MANRADGGATPKAKGSTTTAPAAAAQGYDPQSFAEAVLTKMGLPTSPANIDFFTSWEAAEGGNWQNSASYNPLNTSLPMPGEAGTMGSQGNIRRYSSWQQGIDATVKTLSSHHYTGIIDALHRSDANGAVAALKASPWDVNHYSSGFPLGSGQSYVNANAATPNSLGATAAPGTAANAAAPTGTPNELASQFGYSSAFFNSDPSLKNLIDQYQNQDATNSTVQARFKADLMDTDWYKKHTSAQREWTQLQTSDPTEAAHQLLTLQQQLTAQGKSMGVPLTAGQVATMAKNALSMYGQNVPSNVVQEMIGAQLHYTGARTYTGDVGNDITTLKDLATSYGVPLSDHTLSGWLQNIVTNGTDPKSYSQYLQTQAQSLYPTLAPQLKQGLTFQQAVDPYRQIAAQTTESDPNTIDFTQPKWQKAIMQVDPKTGDRTAMSLADWQNTLRTDPTYGYDKTKQAQAAATDLVSQIGKMWGATG